MTLKIERKVYFIIRFSFKLRKPEEVKKERVRQGTRLRGLRGLHGLEDVVVVLVHEYRAHVHRRKDDPR